MFKYNELTDDLCADLKEVKSNFMKFNKPGDFIRGVLIDRYDVLDQLSKVPGARQTIYEIDVTEGKFHDRGQDGMIAETPTIIRASETYCVGGKPAMDRAMKRIEISQEMAIIFKGTKPSKIPGHQPVKLFNVKAGEMDPVFLKKQEEHSLADNQE